jgi:hypothetical protein
MEIDERIQTIASKEDLADFVAALLVDLNTNPDDWENPTLERFLSAMERWIRSMDNYYVNTGQTPPAVPQWKTFADVLYASKIYE